MYAKVLGFFFNTVKQHLFPLLHEISLKSCIRMFYLTRFNTTSNFILISRKAWEANRFCFALTPWQSHRKWYRMVEVNGAYKHCQYEKKNIFLKSLHVMSIKSFCHVGQPDEHDWLHISICYSIWIKNQIGRWTKPKGLNKISWQCLYLTPPSPLPPPPTPFPKPSNTMSLTYFSLFFISSCQLFATFWRSMSWTCWWLRCSWDWSCWLRNRCTFLGCGCTLVPAWPAREPASEETSSTASFAGSCFCTVQLLWLSWRTASMQNFWSQLGLCGFLADLNRLQTIQHGVFYQSVYTDTTITLEWIMSNDNSK